jgi:hypothetical protein
VLGGQLPQALEEALFRQDDARVRRHRLDDDRGDLPFARTQQARKIPRVGFLGNSTAALEANLIGPFREGLRELGYEEGRNIAIEYRWAEGKYERFPARCRNCLPCRWM